jgi:hypothetical protein
VSPRRFNRRTYVIVTSGRSALTFKAAMSASSASTTILSAFPCTLSPTVNCHAILSLPFRLNVARGQSSTFWRAAGFANRPEVIALLG